MENLRNALIFFGLQEGIKALSHAASFPKDVADDDLSREEFASLKYYQGRVDVMREIVAIVKGIDKSQNVTV